MSLKPHYLPERPDLAEARGLTIALDQSRLLVQELLAGTVPPAVVEGEEIIGRKQDDQGVWQTAVLKLPPPIVLPALRVDPERCQAALQRCRRSRQVWEATMISAGVVDAEDGSGDFWARLLLCIDRETGLVLGGEILGPDDDAQDALLSVVEQTGLIPRTVNLTSGLLESELGRLARVLSIRLRRVDHLPAAEATRTEIKRAFG